MHSRGAATTIISPITNEKMEVCSFAFVDDTDLIAMSPSGQNDGNDARTRMQTVINEWEAVSKTTGGALAPNKCWGWIISFDWDKDVWKYSVHDDSETPMTVKNECEEVNNIETLQASQAK